jgi:hypothetical protein
MGRDFVIVDYAGLGVQPNREILPPAGRNPVRLLLLRNRFDSGLLSFFKAKGPRIDSQDVRVSGVR